jgi:predicted DCC family thiol-disulfide oxidoreductase YuxK
MEELKDKQIVLFDGICNLCAGTVQFLLKRNSKENLLFASLQGEYGQKILQHYHLSLENFTSFIFLDKGELYKKSDAALTIVKYLDSFWPLLKYLKIFPLFIRNGVYDLVAQNRYRWFGQKSECWLPSPALKRRFL